MRKVQNSPNKALNTDNVYDWCIRDGISPDDAKQFTMQWASTMCPFNIGGTCGVDHNTCVGNCEEVNRVVEGFIVR